MTFLVFVNNYISEITQYSSLPALTLPYHQTKRNLNVAAFAYKNSSAKIQDFDISLKAITKSDSPATIDKTNRSPSAQKPENGKPILLFQGRGQRDPIAFEG
jgi:hypothetical protein